jgi:hypothetical protein
MLARGPQAVGKTTPGSVKFPSLLVSTSMATAVPSGKPFWRPNLFRPPGFVWELV